MLGRYEIIAELGHGGMAVVYRARDTQLLRDVAVKVLHPHLANEVESRQRFLREAQAAARLRHPNIVEVFDFSVEEDGESYMVTELLEGPTLRKFVESRLPIAAEVVAAMGVVLCDALDCAHAQGVVHRDVKPDNIMLHKGGLLKLTDFGIAHVADAHGMTITGQILGSPAHMAPEQIEGTSVDARTDLFSLGTVLYFLAVGRLPFEAPVAHALLRKILEADYVDALRAQPLVGHRFAEIIRKCMARSPDDRFANAKALRRELCDFCAEIGWDDPAAKLKEYITDPEAFAELHKTVLVEKLADLGEKAQNKRLAHEALGYFNRALAFDPGNARVLKLVRSVALRRRRERTLRAAAVVVVSAAVSASLGGVAFAMWRQHTQKVQHNETIVHVDPQVVGVHNDSGVLRAAMTITVDTGALPTAIAESDAGAFVMTAEIADAALIRTVSTQVAIRTNAVGTNINARTITNPQSNGANTASNRTRRVNLRLRMTGGFSYALDQGARLPYYTDVMLDLRVGRHSVQIFPNNERECPRPAQWSFDVVPGESIQSDPIPGLFHCASSSTSENANPPK